MSWYLGKIKIKIYLWIFVKGFLKREHATARILDKTFNSLHESYLLPYKMGISPKGWPKYLNQGPVVQN